MRPEPALQDVLGHRDDAPWPDCLVRAVYRLPNEFAKQLYGITEIGTQVMITDDAEIAEQKRIQDEYQRAQEDHARTVADQQAAADSVLINHARAKAAHEKILRQHEADMARYRAEIAATK